MSINTVYALVLGGYVNGYSIIKELHENEVENIALFDDHKSLGSVSNKIKYFELIKNDTNGLKKAIINLKKKCDFIVIYPTNDVHLENLYSIYNDISDFCHIPFNQKNIISSLDKKIQYSFCEKYNIPYPKTKFIDKISKIDLIDNMILPILIKPNKKHAKSLGVFRSMLIKDVNEISKKKKLITSFLNIGIEFIASEFIPGDDTNIHAYVGYRNSKGHILNEWIGKKLTQHPDNFGVYSSAINYSSEIVRYQGRKLLEVMDLFGICEPEFKFDVRDGKYKLMEINLRSMMWHRLGNLSGVHLHYTQFLDALAKETKFETQNLKGNIHFVYMKHEISNLIFRKKYWKHFKENVFGSEFRFFAIYDKSDIKPFLHDSIGLIKTILGRWRKQLKEK